jgi:hypothetical protein
VVIGVANGVGREATFARCFGERTAHNLSALTGIAAFASYFSFLQRRWPLASDRDALKIGGRWLLMTIAFEFVFGRLVAKLSWRELLADYTSRRAARGPRCSPGSR